MRHRAILITSVVAVLGGLLIYATTSGCSGDEKPPKRTPTVVDPATTGSVKGVVLFKGTPPVEPPIDGGGDAVCRQEPPAPNERVKVSISKADGRQILQNAFVYVKSGLKDFVPVVPDAPVVV